MQHVVVGPCHIMFVVKTVGHVIEGLNFAKDLWFLEGEF